MERGEQSALIRGDEARPSGGLVLRLKSESREALVKENGRGGKRRDVCQPATGAGEPREFVERDDELPSECKANREGRATIGVKRCHERIVEVEHTDLVADTNRRAVGESERSVTTPDLNAGH